MWWRRLDPEARRMVDLKRRFGDYPNGNGPAERVALAIKGRLGERTRVFRNAERLATVVALMGIDLAEQASQTACARVLRAAFTKSGWSPDHDREGPHDYYRETASLDEMIMAAWEGGAAESEAEGEAVIASPTGARRR